MGLTGNASSGLAGDGSDHRTHPPHDDEHAGSRPMTDRERRLERLKKLAVMLDAQFGIAGIRFGLDSIIGLIPGIGDTVTGFLSLWIVWQGIRLGVGPGAVIRMLINILIDLLVGSIPILGDIFDVAFKANLANIRLIQRTVGDR